VLWGKRGPVASCLVTLLGAIAGGAIGIGLTFRVMSARDDAFAWLGMFSALGFLGAFLGAGLAIAVWLFLTQPGNTA
jgi:hypothetical protein